jgi:hypothetical protein
MKEIDSKDLYYHILYPLEQPKCMASWNTRLHSDLDWDQIFMDHQNLIREKSKRISVEGDA